VGPILLVKHAMPVVDPATPPATWPLSVAGRRRVIALAASLGARQPTRVVASPERKAKETGEILAATLRAPLDEHAALREHERPGLPHEREAGAFERRIEEAFARPADRLAVVSHGTVIAGFVARVTGADALALWRSLALPSWVALDVGQRRLVDGWRAAWSDGGAASDSP